MSRREKILQALSQKIVEKIQDPYGNYAITDIINNWSQNDCLDIFKSLHSHLSSLCMQKCSSNVVERCFEKAPDSVK